MKLKVNQSVVVGALRAATRVAPKNATIPIITHVLIDAKSPGSLSIKSTDLKIELTSDVSADVEQGGTVCVSAFAFRDVISKLPKDADIRIEKDGDRISVKSGRSRFHLNVLSGDDWPQIVGTETPYAFRMPSKELAQAINNISFAISNEETRFYLNGIYMHIPEGRDVMRFVATDGHRLARVEMTAPAGSNGAPGVIIPKETVLEAANLLAHSHETVTVKYSQNFIVFDFGDVILKSKLIDGSYPDYERVIPNNNEKIAVVDAGALAQSAARVATVSSDKGSAIRMRLDGGVMTLSVTSPDTGDATDEIEALWGDGEFTIGFNSKYVQECLDVLGDGPVTLKLKDPGAPCLMQSQKKPEMLVVLMPMRV